MRNVTHALSSRRPPQKCISTIIRSELSFYRVQRFVRILILSVVTGLGWGIPSLLASSLFGQLTDPAAKATILAAIIALFGVFFTAIFSEISNYYTGKGLGMQKKWELIFPLLRDHYNPWIQSASYLSKHLKRIKDSAEFSTGQIARCMFYLSLFFAHRLRFSIEAGGRPILAEDKDEAEVLEAYEKVEKSLDWKGEETRSDVSILQTKFIQKDKPENPYSSDQFIKDVNGGTDKDLTRIRDEFGMWLNRDRATRATIALDEFESQFKKAIRKLYSGWAT